jgi:hypothetical protein
MPRSEDARLVTGQHHTTVPGSSVGQAVLLFFWDYDTQWGGDRSRSTGGPKDWGFLEFENTERLLELHSEYGIPACFAVVGAAARPGKRPYHDPDQIRRIHRAGHEVASHSLLHEWLPGLNRQALRETVRISKDLLEQCVGQNVVTFVPPFNQPFDYLQGGAISISERREARGARTDLHTLCGELLEAGYHFCRVAYKPLREQLVDRLLSDRVYRPSRREQIAGVTCIRLNTDAGFEELTVALVRRCIAEGGYAVVHGHPHSLREGCEQDEGLLRPFLSLLADWRRQGLLRIELPRDLVGTH